jgi:hypothetical protein
MISKLNLTTMDALKSAQLRILEIQSLAINSGTREKSQGRSLIKERLPIQTR